MSINEIILYVMMVFLLIGAVDRVFSQFGGSEKVLGHLGLGWLGRGIGGSGGQFEEGFMAMGALGLAMVGITALAPVLANLLGPLVIPLYESVGASPAMFAGTLLANDMGAFSLAKELAGGLPSSDLADLIQQLTDQMHNAAAELQFEVAARYRDEISELKKELRQMTNAGMK